MSDNSEMYRMALASLIAVGEAAGVRAEDQLNGAAEIIEAIDAIKARRESWRWRAELAEAKCAALTQRYDELFNAYTSVCADAAQAKNERAAIAQQPAAAPAAQEPVIGWAFHNPDTGWEWHEDHPVESGMAEDATEIQRMTKDQFHADFGYASAPSAAEQPEKLLAQPAKVGAVLFHAGVPERLVIECAQWHYGYEQAPPFGDDQIAGLAQALGAAKQSDAVKAPRELLELAAKAAGLTVDRYSECGLYIYTGTLGKWWSPLMDDGDALRLAAKLEIGVMIKRGGDPYERNRSVVVFDSAQRRLTEPHKGDECAATRRAIVRAAAEIGRGAE